MRHARALLLFVLVAVVTLLPALGCGAPATRNAINTALGACDGDKPETCEAAISGALDRGEDPAPFLKTYLAARTAKGDGSLSGLAAALEHAEKHALLVRVAGAGPAQPGAFELAAPPKLVSISLGALVLAMGRVAKASLVVVTLPGDKTLRVYPSDPLSPLMGGLAPFAWSRGAPDLATEAALEGDIARATDAASVFDYVAAASAVDTIDAYSAAHPGYAVPALRAHVASNAVSLSAPVNWSSPASPPAPAEPPPEPAEDDTPYLDLLRVRNDARAIEWEKRSARILAAFPADQRAAVDAVFSDKPPCGAVVPPPITRERDLLLAGLVPRALLPAHAHAARGRIALEPWFTAYSALVATVDKTRTGYLFVHTLVAERGQSAGIVPSGSEAHRIVTGLALRHARALKKLAAARPGRVGFNQLGFLVAAGNLVDPELRKEVIDLADLAARGGMEGAKDSGDALLALLAGALTGLELPGELREAHFAGLSGVFANKLKGAFANKTGWGVAALYAIDGAYRLALNASPDLLATAREVERALETDPSIAQPALASLAAAVTRYVALGRAGQLGAEVAKASEQKPERAAARAALAKALSGLGEGPANDALVRDAVDLTDGTIATLATSLDLAGTATPAKKQSACTAGEAPLDPRVKNALAHLRDTRRALFANAEWKAPTSERARRIKLVALVLSDVMDALEDNGEEKHPFAISRDDARKILGDALTPWIHEAGLPEALSAGYLTLRGFVEHGKAHFEGAGSGDIRDLLASLGTFFSGGEGQNIEGAALLAMLLPKAGAGAKEDLTSALLDAARALYATKRSQQADMVLLGMIVVAAVRNAIPSAEALALAKGEKSEVGWVLAFMSSVHEVRLGHTADVAAFEPGMSRAVDAQCGTASVKEIGSVLGAVGDYAAGKHKEARATLAAVLDDARAKGLSVPRYSFAFKQETVSRAFSLTLDVGLAQGFVSNINSFNIGAGAKTAGEPSLKLSQSISSAETKQALDDSARYVVHASALLAIYDFLDGDPEAGEIVAARTLGLVTQHGWLGASGYTDEPSAWAKESRAALAILGELAAESGRPLLAGDLFTVVKATLDSSETLDAIDRSLEDPIGLVALPELKGTSEKAKQIVHRLAAGLPCVKAKAPVSQDRVTCAEFPTALALRVADAATVLPTLGPKAGRCAELSALDAFLKPADTRIYDPDKFLAAVDALMAVGKNYDATVLLAKHRREDHCSPAVSSRLAALADRMKGAPVARADLLTAIANCSSGAQPAVLAKAVSLLDDELTEVGDPRRSASLALFAAGVGAKIGTWEPLEAIALKPGFVERWEATYPEAIGAALVLDHAATILHGDAVRIDATAPQYELVCGGMPAPDRATICKTLDALRKKGPPDDALKKAASDALGSLTGPKR